MRIEQPNISQLIEAKKCGKYILPKDTLFYLQMYPRSKDLYGGTAIIKTGTAVQVEAIYNLKQKSGRYHRCARLVYTDRAGKVWRSYTHAKR